MITSLSCWSPVLRHSPRGTTYWISSINRKVRNTPMLTHFMFCRDYHKPRFPSTAHFIMDRLIFRETWNVTALQRWSLIVTKQFTTEKLKIHVEQENDMEPLLSSIIRYKNNAKNPYTYFHFLKRYSLNYRKIKVNWVKPNVHFQIYCLHSVFFHGNNTYTSVYRNIQQLFPRDCHFKKEIKVG